MKTLDMRKIFNKMRKKRNYKLFYLAIIPVFCFNCSKQENIEFIPLPMYTVIDTFDSRGTMRVASEEIFLMRNYKDNEAVELQIDNFVCEIPEGLKTKYDQLTLSFVRESRVSNLEKFEENERNLFRYSAGRDFLYSFHFEKESGFKFRYKYRKKRTIGTKYQLKCN